MGRFVCCLLALVPVSFPVAPVAPSVSAATLTWDPAEAGGGDGTWDTTTASWNNGGSDVSWSNGTDDTASFGGTAGTVTLGEAITAGGLDFAAGGYTVTGNTLTISGGGPLNVGSGLSATLASALSAADGIEKTGGGTMVLSGSNTYTGTTTVNAGTLVGGVSAGYGGGSAPAFGVGDVVVNAGATITGSTSFSVGGGDDTTRRVTLNGGTWDASYANAGAEYVRYLDMTAGSLTVSAAEYIRTPYGGGLEVTTFAADTSSRITAGIALTRGNLSLNVADGAATDDLVLSGSLLPYGTNNPQAVIKSGAGTAVLTGTGTYTGGTSVNDGVLQIGTALTSGGGVLPTTGDTAIAAGATLRFAHGVTGPEYAGTLSGSGTLEVVGTGGTSNDLRLSGDNSSFTGSVEIAGGHLRAANAAALSATNAVTISDSGLLSVFAYGAGNQYDITIGSLASADATALVRLGGSTNRGLTVGDATSTTYAGQIRNDAGGSGAMVKVGSGALTLTGVNDFSGGLSISEGTIVAGNANALGSGSVTIASGAFLEVVDGVTVANSMSLAGGAISRPSSVGSTVADIVAGSAGNAVSLAPVISWTAGTPGTTFSDVLSLTNTSGVAQVLSMTFDPTGLDQTIIDSLELGWFNTATQAWVNALDGNSSGTPTFFSGSWADYLEANPTATPTTALGVYGRDTASNTAWAVIDHNSDFAVVAVPEPSAVVMAAGLACLPLLLRRRQRGA
jgi:autotransporter-associated beta strand protein